MEIDTRIALGLSLIHMTEEPLGNFMDRATPEQKIAIKRQAIRGLRRRIDTYQGWLKDPTVSDDRKAEIEKDLTETHKKIADLEKQIQDAEEMEKKPPTPDQ